MTDTVHIFLYDREDKFEPQSIWLYKATFDRNKLSPHDLPNAVKLAFTNWALTTEGQRFIEENGCNWGDALSIPTEFLKGVGIKKLVPMSFQQTIVVDHNEHLVERKIEIEIKVPGE